MLTFTTVWGARAMAQTSDECESGNCEAIQIADAAAQVVKDVRDYVTLDEYKVYFLPVKINAGKLKAIARARESGFSKKLNTRLQILLAEFKRIQIFIESKMEIEALYDELVDITALKEAIDAALE